MVEDPDERESTDIAWTGDVRLKLAEGREWFAGAFYMDTDRAETEIGREFEAEDDDGEVETDAIQANQLDAFQETNYGVFTGFETRLRQWPFVGDRARLRRDRVRLGRDQLGRRSRLRLRCGGHRWMPTASWPSSSRRDAEIISLFGGRAAQRRRPARRRRLPGHTRKHRRGRLGAQAADRGELAARLVEAEGRRRGLGPRSATSRSARSRWTTACSRKTTARSPLFEADDQRAALFLKWSKDFGDDKSLELGVRGEYTSLDIDATVSEALAEAAAELATIGIIIDGNQIHTSEDSSEFNPSAHFRWDVTDRTLVRLSVARTIRRPSFDQLNPTLIIDDEESILGNPSLDARDGARR